MLFIVYFTLFFFLFSNFLQLLLTPGTANCYRTIHMNCFEVPSGIILLFQGDGGLEYIKGKTNKEGKLKSLKWEILGGFYNEKPKLFKFCNLKLEVFHVTRETLHVPLHSAFYILYLF